MVTSTWFIFWEKYIYIQLSAQDHSKCRLFAFMSLVLMDVSEFLWRHAVRYLSHFVVALSALGAAQVVSWGKREGSRTWGGQEEERVLFCVFVCEWGCVVQQGHCGAIAVCHRDLHHKQAAADSAWFWYSVLITGSRTEPQDWAFVKFNHL